MMIANCTCRASRLALCLTFVVTLFGSASPVGAVENVIYFHNDANGSPIAATDEFGQVVWQESYEPFGDRRLESRSAQEQPLWFTGKSEEPELGLQYFGARWYMADVGRFTTVDPAGVNPANPTSFNRYAYANNNPYRFIDPDGREAVNIRMNARIKLLAGGYISEESYFDYGYYEGLVALPGLALLAPSGSGVALSVGVLASESGVILPGPPIRVLPSVAKGVSAKTPVGRKGQHLGGFDPKNPTNAPGKIGDREFSGHAFDRMQSQGIPPSAVNNAIKNGKSATGKFKGTTAHHDTVNNMTVITDTASGRVITVDRGIIRQ